MGNYEFLLANCGDIAEIICLYHSVIGTPGCAWNLNYPDIESARLDIENESLYILKENDKIIAAASIGRPDEPEDFLWELQNPCELARVCVTPLKQKQGVGAIVLQHSIIKAKEKKFDGIIMLVSKSNIAALALYDNNGFEKCGEMVMYDIDFYCYQMKF